MNIYICFVEKHENKEAFLNLKDITLSIIIVNYKSWKYLDECLDALSGIISINFVLDIIVVDNDFLSDARIEFEKKYKQVSFIGNTGNNGFANACNLGAQNAKGQFYLFLNPDTIVTGEALEEMLLTAVKNKEYGIVSCVQENDRGASEKQIRFFPELKTIFGLFRALYKTRNKRELYTKYGPKQRVIFPDWVSGSVVLISKEWFELVGGFNQDYWMYYEDVDLCKKVSEHSGKIALLRDVKIIHNHGGASRINVTTSALTKSHVLISKHIYVCNYIKGPIGKFIQIILVFYTLVIKGLSGLLGLILFFIPKMYLRFFVYKNMILYYKSALLDLTWLSDKSMNHPVNKCDSRSISNKMVIGYDAKRIFHNRTGLGNYSRDLISVLARYFKGNTYLLYNPKGKSIDRLELTENVVEVLPNTGFWKKNSSLWRQGPIVKQLCQDGVSVFHGLSGEIPRGLKSANIKSVVTIHDLIFVRYPKMYKYMDRKIHFKKFLFAAQNADIVIAISEQTKRDVVEFLDINEDKIKVVYQGCHALFKENQSDLFKEKVRGKFKLPENFILTVGTIEERKNLLLSVKAIKNLEVVLIVVGGKTRYYDAVRKYIIEHDIQSKVKFLENVDLKELVAMYQMADLFLYPSLFEGFGIPIIEALYSKTPVITSTGGCFSEAGGPNSIYVSPTDPVELEQRIIEVLNDEELKKNMIEKGYEFVQKFNEEEIGANIMNVYKAL